ncbi:MAG TPA: VTT domain-containing protein [Terriglobia bacterium]|nr:VTT domain-containing protein [Terriglobia bacterium]
MHLLPYLGILVAAVVEGEVVYSGAVVLVHLGRLNAMGVLMAGTAGGWAGDQFYFYLARGRARQWLDRFEKIAKRRRLIQSRMQRHATKFILALRFLPGLRIAIPIACAYAGISPVKFSGLSFISALAWASAIMFTIRWLGPASLGAFGLRAWWTPIIPAALLVLFFRWLARAEPVDEPPAE